MIKVEKVRRNIHRRNIAVQIVLWSLLTLLAGCASAPEIAVWSPQMEGSHYLARGSEAVTITPITGIADTECVAAVELIAPARYSMTSKAVPLIFAHGFLRENARHRDWATHVASWGVPVYLVGLCSGGWNRGGAAVFSRLLVRVADVSGAPRVMYRGFSAGGGASRLAALRDARTVGYLGLDPVGRLSPDAKNTESAFPMMALFAPKTSCNGQHVGVDMFRLHREAIALEIENTTHCHFESPSDLLCHAACGEPTTAAVSQLLRNRIASLSVSYLRWRAGLDADALAASPTPAMWRMPLPGVRDLVRK